MQPLKVSTSQSMFSGSRSIHRFGHTDMMHLVFATRRLLEVNMWNRRLCISASNLERVSYATRCVAKALAAATHWQVVAVVATVRVSWLAFQVQTWKTVHLVREPSKNPTCSVSAGQTRTCAHQPTHIAASGLTSQFQSLVVFFVFFYLWSHIDTLLLISKC